MDNILGYFMETDIWWQGKLQPPRKTPITLIGDTPAFDLNAVSDDDDISVLSQEGNWYTIKKRDLILD